jgi:hypothetical protein
MLGIGQAPSTLFICCHFLLFIKCVCVCVYMWVYVGVYNTHIHIHAHICIFAVLWLGDLCLYILLRIVPIILRNCWHGNWIQMVQETCFVICFMTWSTSKNVEYHLKMLGIEKWWCVNIRIFIKLGEFNQWCICLLKSVSWNPILDLNFQKLKMALLNSEWIKTEGCFAAFNWGVVGTGISVWQELLITG